MILQKMNCSVIPLLAYKKILLKVVYTIKKIIVMTYSMKVAKTK